MEEEANREENSKLTFNQKLKKYKIQILLGTAGSLLAALITFSSENLTDPSWIASLMLTQDGEMDLASDLLEKNKKNRENYKDEFEEQGVIFEEDVYNKAAKMARMDKSERRVLLDQLRRNGLSSTDIEKILEKGLEWFSLDIPTTSEMVTPVPRPTVPRDDGDLNVGGPIPVVTTLTGTKGPAGEIIVPNISSFGYRYSNHHPLPSSLGPTTRLSFYSSANGRKLDLIIAKYGQAFDPSDLPTGYNSNAYNYFIRQSGGYIFIVIGNETQDTLEKIGVIAISDNIRRNDD
ncbi:MAG: hypothetical protein AAGB13_12845 [Cyanobacteria bacterium P01_F01_bin.33]